MRASLKLRSTAVTKVGIACRLVLAVLVLGLLCSGTALAAGPAQSRGATHVGRQAAALLRLGSRGAAVRSLQSTLARLTYLPYSGVDGVFGMQTWHAVVAFQGWSWLTRDGIVGPRTQSALSRARRPRPWSTATGIEIHIAQQVLLLVRNGGVQRAIHVSTGKSSTPTPLGHFRITGRDPMSWSHQFHTWMPLAQYFYRGYAIHQYASVPPYPASHGCVRVPAAEAQSVWQFGRVGMRVWTTARITASVGSSTPAYGRGCR